MSRPRKPNISIFFPCYNDKKTIGRLLRTLFLSYMIYGENLSDRYDDDSKDIVEKILKNLSK